MYQFQVVTEEDIEFKEDFVIPDYETLYADGNSVITETAGFFGGTATNWITIENHGIIYFYYQFLDKDMKLLSEPTYLNYAIVGDQYFLECGIYIGMSEEEVFDVLPDCMKCKPENTDGVDAKGVYSWNVNAFPEGWCESFHEIIMARIDYNEELPWYLGLMINEDGIVKAITTCYPTAG